MPLKQLLAALLDRKALDAVPSNGNPRGSQTEPLHPKRVCVCVVSEELRWREGRTQEPSCEELRRVQRGAALMRQSTSSCKSPAQDALITQTEFTGDYHTVPAKAVLQHG